MASEIPETLNSDYDRRSEVHAFDGTKTGVKGLIDGGATQIPRIFIDKDRISDIRSTHQLSIPVIDLKCVEKDPTTRVGIIQEIRSACENWGFFQVINHGIPVSVLDEMINGVRRFHEQDSEIKRKVYSRDPCMKVSYNCNIDLLQSRAANWRDTLSCAMAPHPPQLKELPQVCREIVVDYSNHVSKLGNTVFELLSEALGLNTSCLKDMDCGGGLLLLGHYYPKCPEPELTQGTHTHTDGTFITILLQDHIGGLQVLHSHHWVDVAPQTGALVVNVGDLLQLMSNDRFISVKHRVLVKNIGPRISVACFFRTQGHSDDALETRRLYGPIKELLSEQNPPIYKDVSAQEYLTYRYSRQQDDSILQHFKL